MIISGNNYRSLAERDELSFSAQLSIDSLSGEAEFGFSGAGEGIKWGFSSGRMISPDGRYFNSYKKDGGFTLSGNLETGVYDYYIDDKLNSNTEIKNNFKINKFFVNTKDCNLDFQCSIYATKQDHFLQYSDKYEPNNTLLGNVKNNQEEEFTIFTGKTFGGGFELDNDVPSGVHDGTYLQDYKYFSGSGDLDECNGRYGITPEYPSGIYHYHITDDWPYVLSCFKGTPVDQTNKISEVLSGTSPSGLPSVWLTEDFFDRQTLTPQSDNVRHYTSGVSVNYSNEYAYIQSKAIPNHFYGPFSGNPNAVSQQNQVFKIPLNPDVNPDQNNPQKKPTPLHMGNVGVAINGVPIDLLTNEFYKNRNHWRVVAKPGQLGLDKHNAHVQPNGKYHYHASPSGIINDYNFTTPSITVTGIPENYSVFSGVGFSKYSNAFGVNVFATSGVSDWKISRVSNIIAECLDNDLDGAPDNISVVNSLFANQASIIMTSGELSKAMNFGSEGVSGIDTSLLTGHYALQELQGNSVKSGIGEFDGSLEKVLNLITKYGWSDVYPSTFGTLSGSLMANYMDSGRGGHFEWCDRHTMPNGRVMFGPIHGINQTCVEWGAVYPIGSFTSGKAYGSYPSGSYFHHADSECDYDCQSLKYFYFGLTTIMGAQTGRHSENILSWEYNTPTGLQSGDPNFYNLLTNSEYKLPTGYIPTGVYTPSASSTVYASTGHSPLMGYAADGYPIYGPRGYTDPAVSGEVKVMKSSYLPKNIDRAPAYPKTIKKHNDLYLPYHVDLLSLGANAGEGSIILYTNLQLCGCVFFEHVVRIKMKAIARKIYVAIS